MTLAWVPLEEVAVAWVCRSGREEEEDAWKLEELLPFWCAGIEGIDLSRWERGIGLSLDGEAETDADVEAEAGNDTSATTVVRPDGVRFLPACLPYYKQKHVELKCRDCQRRDLRNGNE